ncbi:MAG: two-component system, chemotaxis family, sensor kinase CheA, partial [Acidobacteriota bacterium]|nr:two-component system, chemotaxis family, sensor kinase CheA [Acidobacteriota bacterium]
MSDLNPDDGGEFFAQFLDDYFAECDEHLTLVRRHLLALEEQVGRPFVEPSSLDELFRSFHTLKGISAMVGLEEAEQLAHHMESFLRALRHAETPLDVEGVEALMAGTTLLEQVIAALRQKESAPDIDAAVARLLAVVSKSMPVPEEPATVQAAGESAGSVESERDSGPLHG